MLSDVAFDGRDEFAHAGKRSATDSGTGTVARSYDGLDGVTSETTPQGNVSYSYDAAGRRTSMTVGGQAPVNYAYDDDNRVVQIAQGASTVAFSYDTDSRRTTLTLPNGVTMSYSYDAASQLTGINYSLGMTELGNLAYGYDMAGRRNLAGGNFARTGMPSTLTSASYNVNNQLTQFGTSSFSYDTNGNLTSDGTNSYIWNARSELVSISGGASASFNYDAFGRRVSKTIGATTTGYIYDGVNPVEELSGAGVGATMLTGGVDEYFQRTDSSGTFDYLTDALGSTVALAGPAGAFGTQYTYEPFGNTTTSGPASANPFRFTGRENDGAGLYFYRSRFYSPTLQRFISEDPTEFGGGINLYGYVGNNPVSEADPAGTQGIVEDALNYLDPPAPLPIVAKYPPGAILWTQYGSSTTRIYGNQFQPNGTTTFYVPNEAPFSIPTLNRVDSRRSKRGANDPYCSVGVVVRSGQWFPGYAQPAYGGTYIDTGDPRGRGIHGGGSSLKSGAYDPDQPLTPTLGCSRAHNQDVVNLGNLIQQYQEANPNFPIPYCRSH
jgi:RHS repeat-associated protein